MEEVPSSPTSVVVNSPRRTLSLVRRDRRASVWLPPTSPADERPSPSRAGPNPTEVYGFVGSITTVIATAVYLGWAYTPEPWLHSLGITYYPNKYWALAVPAFAMITVTLVIVFYLGLNFMVTAPPTSLNTIFDEYSREKSLFSSSAKGEEQPIEPISDIGIDQINDLMFGKQS